MSSLSKHQKSGQVLNHQGSAAEEGGGNGPLGAPPKDPNGPSSSIRRNNGDDDDDNGGPPPAASKIAYCINGLILITLEDAKDRDLTGLTVVQCLVIDDPEEMQRVRELIQLGQDDVVSRILGGLPKRK